MTPLKVISYKLKATGFTLLEVVIVIAIIGLISTIIIIPLAGLREKQALKGGAEEALSLLSEARIKTLGSEGDSQYGVRFDRDKMVLFKGAAYIAGAADNREIMLDNLIEATTVSLAGGGDEVIFKRLTGKTDEIGTVTLSLKSDGTQMTTISIGLTGVAGLN